MAGRANTKKASSAAADKSRAGEHHEARPVNRGGETRPVNHWECRATTGAARLMEWTHKSSELGEK